MYCMKRKRGIGIYVVLLVFMLLVGCLAGIRSKAAEPKVMVTDYKVNPAAVISGDSFKLTLTIKNTAARKVKNLKLSVISEEGNLLPAKGAGTAYISELAAGEELEQEFDMTAVHGLEEKAYKLVIKSEYEDTAGVSYTVEDNIFIPISLEQRLSVTDIFADDSVKLGDDVEITGSVNNLGEGTLYNVCVTVEGDNVDKQTSYVGNIESGKSGNIDIITRTTHVTEVDRQKNSMIIAYEDKQGKKYEQQADVGIYVEAIDYSNLQVLKETKEKELSKTAVVIAAVLVIAVLVIILAVMKWRKKKRILEEF